VLLFLEQLLKQRRVNQKQKTLVKGVKNEETSFRVVLEGLFIEEMFVSGELERLL
jgi:hypothetical protein